MPRYAVQLVKTIVIHVDADDSSYAIDEATERDIQSLDNDMWVHADPVITVLDDYAGS